MLMVLGCAEPATETSVRQRGMGGTTFDSLVIIAANEKRLPSDEPSQLTRSKTIHEGWSQVDQDTGKLCG